MAVKNVAVCTGDTAYKKLKNMPTWDILPMITVRSANKIRTTQRAIEKIMLAVGPRGNLADEVIRQRDAQT